ncbi:Acg family FMN-binding oxidoreductase [Microlunatus ginsengisoli]|uniref:Tat pathway signal protein n=1 Tax=Microlunatus ginsengisoli TaxID=363863 RepID=A0ABP6ZP00_9ACTN
MTMIDTSGPTEAAVANQPSRISRRRVLQVAGVGGATVLVAGGGLLSYRAHDTGALRPGSGTAYEPWDGWRDDPSPLGAVAAAVLAANPHNTQPWTFRVSDTSIELSTDGGRRMPTVDPYDREQQIGLGCALENLVLALDARGYRTEVATGADADHPGRLAAVEFRAGTPVASALYEAIGDRHTDRGPYRPDPVPAAVLTQLGAHDDLAGVGLTWIEDAGDRAALSALLITATEAIIADREQSEEAFSWFRSGPDDIERHRDGLTLDGQGFGPVKLAVAKLLPPSSRTDGDAFWLDQTRTVHTATAAAYGVVTADDVDDTASRLAGGRLLQRMHLRATVAGLGLQPMNQVTERIDRERSLGRTSALAAPLARLLADGGQPLVAFRIGYPTRAARRSPRRPVSAVTA